MTHCYLTSFQNILEHKQPEWHFLVSILGGFITGFPLGKLKCCVLTCEEGWLSKDCQGNKEESQSSTVAEIASAREAFRC